MSEQKSFEENFSTNANKQEKENSQRQIQGDNNDSDNQMDPSAKQTSAKATGEAESTGPGVGANEASGNFLCKSSLPAFPMEDKSIPGENNSVSKQMDIPAKETIPKATGEQSSMEPPAIPKAAGESHSMELPTIPKAAGEPHSMELPAIPKTAGESHSMELPDGVKKENGGVSKPFLPASSVVDKLIRGDNNNLGKEIDISAKEPSVKAAGEPHSMELPTIPKAAGEPHSMELPAIPKAAGEPHSMELPDGAKKESGGVSKSFLSASSVVDKSILGDSNNLGQEMGIVAKETSVNAAGESHSMGSSMVKKSIQGESSHLGKQEDLATKEMSAEEPRPTELRDVVRRAKRSSSRKSSRRASSVVNKSLQGDNNNSNKQMDHTAKPINSNKRIDPPAKPIWKAARVAKQMGPDEGKKANGSSLRKSSPPASSVANKAIRGDNNNLSKQMDPTAKQISVKAAGVAHPTEPPDVVRKGNGSSSMAKKSNQGENSNLGERMDLASAKAGGLSREMGLPDEPKKTNRGSSSKSSSMASKSNYNSGLSKSSGRTKLPRKKRDWDRNPLVGLPAPASTFRPPTIPVRQTLTTLLRYAFSRRQPDVKKKSGTVKEEKNSPRD